MYVPMYAVLVGSVQIYVRHARDPVSSRAQKGRILGTASLAGVPQHRRDCALLFYFPRAFAFATLRQ